MRNMSFSMTTEQFMDGSKDVTRRFGWWFLKAGDRVQAVEKAMGLKKGEKMKVLGVIEIVSVTKEPLHLISADDCKREGFPHFTQCDFINFILKAFKDKSQDSIINRIEFKRV